MKVIAEFKKFALRGNVVDLSVGIVIGAAFNKIVNSLVSDVVMPPIGLLLGKVDFSNLYINLGSVEYDNLNAAQTAGAPTINYGLFLNALIGFLVTALAVFFLVKVINRLKDKEEAAPESTPTKKPCPFCFISIPVKATRCPECTSQL